PPRSSTRMSWWWSRTPRRRPDDAAQDPVGPARARLRRGRGAALAGGAAERRGAGPTPDRPDERGGPGAGCGRRDGGNLRVLPLRHRRLGPAVAAGHGRRAPAAWAVPAHLHRREGPRRRRSLPGGGGGEPLLRAVGCGGARAARRAERGERLEDPRDVRAGRRGLAGDPRQSPAPGVPRTLLSRKTPCRRIGLRRLDVRAFTGLRCRWAAPPGPGSPRATPAPIAVAARPSGARRPPGAGPPLRRGGRPD